MSAGLVPYEAVRENLLQASVLSSGRLLTIFGVPWLVKHHPNLFLHLHMAFSLCAYLCPDFPLFIRKPRILG